MMIQDLSQSFGPEEITYMTGKSIGDSNADFLFQVVGEHDDSENKTLWRIYEVGALDDTEFSEADLQWVAQNVR